VLRLISDDCYWRTGHLDRAVRWLCAASAREACAEVKRFFGPFNGLACASFQVRMTARIETGPRTQVLREIFLPSQRLYLRLDDGPAIRACDRSSRKRFFATCAGRSRRLRLTPSPPGLTSPTSRNKQPPSSMARWQSRCWWCSPWRSLRSLSGDEPARAHAKQYFARAKNKEQLF
jgi:hypothetical protein